MDDKKFMQTINDLKEWGMVEVNGTKVKLTKKGRELGEKYKQLEREEMARSNFTKPKDMPMDTLADRINSWSSSNSTHSGRGHGRTTAHGRGARAVGGVTRGKKKDMLYFVRDAVKILRMSEPHWITDLANTHDLADNLAQGFQFFDCDEIYDYVFENLSNMYPDPQVPPSEEAVLPAELVGLYTTRNRVVSDGVSDVEMMMLCVPVTRYDREDELYGRHFNVSILGAGHLEMRYPEPTRLGQVNTLDGTFKEDFRHTQSEDGRLSVYSYLRMACGMLQTINHPRFVIAGKRDVSMMKRQSFKKATGRYAPDAWNMVSWNVDKPVKAKDYKEGTGGRLPLHYRRGHWRLAEEGWKNTRWSAERNRWEQYIHGYEAGNPAFGWTKNYHLPRKDH